jgi:hypothetical protein
LGIPWVLTAKKHQKTNVFQPHILANVLGLAVFVLEFVLENTVPIKQKLALPIASADPSPKNQAQPKDIGYP